MLHPAYIKEPPMNYPQNPKYFIINNNSTHTTALTRVNYCIPNNFFTISVLAVLIYVRLSANVLIHQLQFKTTKFYQYLLNEFVRIYHQTIHSIFISNKEFDLIFDFILSTEHLRQSIRERHSSEIRRTRKLPIPNLIHFLILLLLITPVTLASKPTSSRAAVDLLFFSSNSSHRQSWNAGCCRKPNQTMCNTKPHSSLFVHNTYLSNYTNNRTYLYGNVTLWADHHRLSPADTHLYRYDFLNNQTMFCERYAVFRHLSANPLALYTYFIVVTGIILNCFVFLVLVCGSLRKSTSFALFVTLTVFDLLSLASSLFATLFRTVIPNLKKSPLFCKMFGIFFLYFRQCSSTTLLLIAIERCVVIKYPFCRYLFEKYRLPFLACIMFLYATPIPFDFIFYTNGPIHCEAFDTLHAHRYQIFRGFFTVFSYAIIPFVGISISNLLIIFEMKNSKKRFILKAEDGTKQNFANKSTENRGTTVMLFVASFAFLLLLGPFYIHWCVAYVFFDYRECHFTRNLYENVQLCMGVFNPYLTVIEKGMRESSHAINFLLYIATSTRFRSDFQIIMSRLFYRTVGPVILFLCKHICFCNTEPPAFLAVLEQHVSDTIDEDLGPERRRKDQAAYRTSHYRNNLERRKKTRLLQANFSDSNTNSTGVKTSPPNSLIPSPTHISKSVRTLTWNQYDSMLHSKENQRQAIRLSQHFTTTKTSVI